MAMYEERRSPEINYNVDDDDDNDDVNSGMRRHMIDIASQVVDDLMKVH